MEGRGCAPGGESHIVVHAPARALEDVHPVVPPTVAPRFSAVGVRPGLEGGLKGLTFFRGGKGIVLQPSTDETNDRLPRRLYDDAGVLARAPADHKVVRSASEALGIVRRSRDDF